MQHSHGVEGSETFTAVSSEPKASWVVVMYTMNNHILTTRWSR